MFGKNPKSLQKVLEHFLEKTFWKKVCKKYWSSKLCSKKLFGKKFAKSVGAVNCVVKKFLEKE
jgi:hypothetical protein